MLVYIDALSAAGEWQAIIDLLKGNRLPISTTTRNLVLGQSHGQAQGRSQMDVAAQFLREALDQAGPKEQEILLRTASSAEAMGLTSIAKEAYRKLLATRPDGQVALLEKLLQVCQQDRDVDGMVAALKDLHQAKPGFQPYADQLNYLRLISGTEMELAANGIYSTDPAKMIPTQSLPPYFLRALAAKRLVRRADWEAATEKVTSPERLSPGARAMLSGFYADLGQREKAFRLGETLIGNVNNGVVTGDKRGLLLEPELRALERGIR
jgi:hypothetical protein